MELGIKVVRFHLSRKGPEYKNRRVGQRATRDASYKNQTIIYFHREGENVLEDLVNCQNRPYELYKKMIPYILRQMGIEPMKSVWSQKAGCTCPCSPGFLLQNYKGYQHLGDSRLHHYNIHVDFEYTQDGSTKVLPGAFLDDEKFEAYCAELQRARDEKKAMELVGVNMRAGI